MATYYVKIGGNDSAAGTTDGTAWAHHPWMSGWTAAPKTLLAGDIVYLKCGDVWYDTITVAQNGTSSNPITISSYGTGNNPVISGFTTITNGWIDEGGNIYSKFITSSSRTNCVTIDGINTGMGKTPNAGLGRNSWYRRTGWTYLTDHTGTITDTGIGDNPNWTGAEIIFMTHHWNWEHAIITNHSGDVFTYQSTNVISSVYTGDWGYFIQDDIRCLTVTDEWFHDYDNTGKFYIYGNPTGKTVNVATRDYLFLGGTYDYITINNITFEGAIYDCMKFDSGSTNMTINNCIIRFCGRYGIQFITNTSGTINGCTINDIGNTGIWLYGGSLHQTLNNTIYNIGLIYGQAKGGQYLTGVMSSYVVSGLIQYNTIYNSGLNGIHTTGNNSQVKNNHIYNVCLMLSDGGGIYYPGINSVVNHVIDSNIIHEVIGNLDPSPVGVPIARGIYLDDTPVAVSVTNNVLINCSETGIMLSNGSSCVVTGNTVYASGVQQIYFANNNTGLCHDNVVTDNIFFSLDSTAETFFIYNESTVFGTSNNNCYARPINELTDDNTIRYYNGSYNMVDLAAWKTYSGKDVNSIVNQGGPIASINDARIIYNNTNSVKYYLLSAQMKDVRNVAYNNLITLDAWSSLILMGVGTVVEITGLITVPLANINKYSII